MEALLVTRGMHVIIKEHPCKVIRVERSKGAKKCHFKIMIQGIDVLTHTKYTDVYDPSIIIPLCDVTTKEYTLINIIDQNIY